MTRHSIVGLRPTAAFARRHGAPRRAHRSGRVLALGAVALCVAALRPLSAGAEIIQIAGPGFFMHCPTSGCGTLSDTTFGQVATGSLANGLLQNAQGSFYAPVVFPTNGLQVCKFSLVYRDDDAQNDITASLLKKNFLPNQPDAFSAAIVMARVRSNGAQNNTREQVTTKITAPTLTFNTGFYYVELDIPASDLQVVGVQIFARTSSSAPCPG